MKETTRTVQKKERDFRVKSLLILRAILLALWVGLSIVLSQYVVVYTVLFLVGKERAQQPVWVGVCQALSYLLALCLLILATPRIYNIYMTWNSKRKKQAVPTNETKIMSTNKSELGLQKPPTFVDLGLPIVGYVIYLATAQALTVIVEKILPWFNPQEAQQTGFAKFLRPGDRFIAMLTIVFIAPIAEEIIMRGWLYGKVREQLKPFGSMLIVSLIFAVLHGQLNVALATFILSMILCGMREITGTIWSGIILHMIVNGISFYILYVTP